MTDTRDQKLTYNPELKAHSKDFERKIWKVTDAVYSAVGFTMSNSIMIIGKDGIIIIDTLTHKEVADQVLAEFRKITNKPVRAIIYTHHHLDHIGGAQGFANQEDIGNKVDVYAHETTLRDVINDGIMVKPILSRRSEFMFGQALTLDDSGNLNDGLGPHTQGYGTFTFLAPNKTFGDKMSIEIAGVKLELIHVPSETENEIAVWYPEERIMFSAETINPTFPNCYTIRGTPYRDVVSWYQSIDRMREYDPEHMVPSHGNPVLGNKNTDYVMTSSRDMIQYVHDQTIRFMNKGYPPDELAEAIVLPPHLDSIRPYGRQYYGTVKHVVRSIYDGYLGWFNADPSTLNPLPPKERALSYVELAGGQKNMLSQLRKAIKEDRNYRWAAEIATWLIRAYPELQEAKDLKAEAFRELAYESVNAPWRNFYLMGALELEGKLKSTKQAINFGLPDIMAQFRTADVLRGLTIKLDSMRSLDTNMTVAFIISDRLDESHALEIRRGVAEYKERIPSNVDVSLVMKRKVLDEILLGRTTLKQAMQSGDVKIQKGDVEQVQDFFDNFDLGTDNESIRLVDR